MIRNFTERIFRIPLILYILNSVIVSLIDTLIVWVLYREMDVFLVTANTICVISGFLIHYLLSSKSVFQADLGMKGFLIYLGTFLLGLALADSLIYAGEHYIFIGYNESLSFLFSKAISILIPFFMLYYLRKMLFSFLKNRIIGANELQS